MTNPSQSPAHFRMAKATPDDISKLRDFLTKLDSYQEEGIDNDEDFILDIMGDFEGVAGWRRVVEGYQVLVDSACDPALDYLELKPELKAKLEDKPNVFMIEVRCDDKLDPGNYADEYENILSLHSSLELAIAQCNVYSADSHEYFEMASDDWCFCILECQIDGQEFVMGSKLVLSLHRNGEPFETLESQRLRLKTDV